eukprot:jgi/Mesvir1/21731/Mv04141-RA.1
MNRPRQSILNRRPLSSGDRNNVESAAAQYAREQAALQEKRSKFQQVEEHLKKAFYSTPEDRRELSQEFTASVQQQLAAKQLEEERRRAEEERIRNASVSVFPDGRREVEESQRKKEYLRSVMEENKQLAEMRARMKEEELRREREREREDIARNAFKYNVPNSELDRRDALLFGWAAPISACPSSGLGTKTKLVNRTALHGY